MFLVIDRTDTVIRKYSTWEDAYAYCVRCSRPDWRIKEWPPRLKRL